MLADDNQHGPACILDKIRNKVGLRYDEFSRPVTEPGSIAEAITCVWCSSIWIGAGFAIIMIISLKVAFWIGLPFALSAIAIILESIIDGAKK